MTTPPHPPKLHIGPVSGDYIPLVVQTGRVEQAFVVLDLRAVTSRVTHSIWTVLVLETLVTFVGPSVTLGL